MGIAVTRITREALGLCLPIVNAFGALISVSYPEAYGDPCEVRFACAAVPDGAEQDVVITMEQHVEQHVGGATVTQIARLKLADPQEA